MRVTAKNANGEDVPVYQVQFNQNGGVESFLTKVGEHQKWVHASDYQVEVDESAEAVEQPGIMTKDTQLKDTEAIKKAVKDKEVAPPADPAQPDAGADENSTPTPPADLPDDEVTKPEDAPTAPPIEPAKPSKPAKPAKK